MPEKAFQDTYPEALSHCYGCGRLNADGLQIKSYWQGDIAVCRYTPRDHHIAIPGFVYGGLIASLIDCHSTGTASAAASRALGKPLGSDPSLRFVTASLKVDYIRPTPLGMPLEIRAWPSEVKERKVVVESELYADGICCARGTVVAVRMPEHMLGD